MIANSDFVADKLFSGNTFSLLARIWSFIGFRRKFQLLIAALLMVLTSVAELGTLSALLPFLTVLSASSKSNSISSFFPANLSLFAWVTADRLAVSVTAIFIAIVALTTFLRLLTLWFCNLTSASVGSDLARQVFYNILSRPYSTHVTYKTSDLIAASTRDVDMTVATLELFLQGLTSLFASIGIIVGLLYINWQTIFILVIIFIALYLFLGSYTRSILKSNSVLADHAIRNQIQVVQEGLGSIRDVILDDLFTLFADKFFNYDLRVRRIKAVNDFVSTFPRYAFEGFGYIAIAILGFSYFVNVGNGALSIALLGTVAVGTQRLLPCLQKIFACWAGIKSNSNGVSYILQILSGEKSNSLYQDSAIVGLTQGAHPSPEFSNSTGILINSVCYRYPGETSYALRGVNLQITPGSCIGIIGTSGSGKSTLIDLILGLLTPTSGTISFNSVDFINPQNSTEHSCWQTSIAHVPQQPFLVNGDFVENIAFCKASSEVDSERLIYAAKCAHIYDFIASKPDSFHYKIGENGSLLSGGQKQRLGIARAFYKRSNLLILDEATSALDKNTEAIILRNIQQKLAGTTVIMIAHKYSSLSQCSVVYKLENGQIVSSGTPSAMLG